MRYETLQVTCLAMSAIKLIAIAIKCCLLSTACRGALAFDASTISSNATQSNHINSTLASAYSPPTPKPLESAAAPSESPPGTERTSRRLNVPVTKTKADGPSLLHNTNYTTVIDKHLDANATKSQDTGSTASSADNTMDSSMSASNFSNNLSTKWHELLDYVNSNIWLSITMPFVAGLGVGLFCLCSLYLLNAIGRLCCCCLACRCCRQQKQEEDATEKKKVFFSDENHYLLVGPDDSEEEI